MTIQSYIFIIGSTDDFNSIEELLEAYNEGKLEEYNASVFSYDAPLVGDAFGVDIARLIGFGHAFDNGWCQDDTVSYLMVG